MAVMTVHEAAPAGPTAPRSAGFVPIFTDVVRSEWTKLRSLRSTYWTLLASVVAIVGLSALLCALYVHNYLTMSAADRAGFDPTSLSTSGGFLAQLALGVLGVLVITGEYANGAIRTTFAAVPQRRVVLAAKAMVLSGVTLVVSLVASFAAFFLGQAILSGQGLQAHIGDAGVLRAVVGAAAYLTVLGLLGLGLGTLLRRTSGAISALFGLLLVLPGLVQLLPGSWGDSISKLLPSNAGQAITRTVTGPHTQGGPSLAPWTGLGVFCLYAAIALGFAAVALRRRDA